MGADAIAGFFLRIRAGHTHLEVDETAVNGQPGLVARADGQTLAVLAFDVADGRITRLWSVRNPEKLRAWT